ncbi:hypothetical protein EJB05_28496, partial [Eragrostis curvula]
MASSSSARDCSKVRGSSPRELRRGSCLVELGCMFLLVGVHFDGIAKNIFVSVKGLNTLKYLKISTFDSTHVGTHRNQPCAKMSQTTMW